MTSKSIKFPLIVIFLICFTQAYSQSQPGLFNFSLSSAFTGQFFTETLTFDADNTIENKISQFNFQPTFGLFFSNLIKAGLYTDFEFGKETDKDNNYHKKSSSSFGAYFRIHFNDQVVSPFINSRLGYGGYRLEKKEGDNSSNLALNGIEYDIGLGVEFFVKRKCSFEILFDYCGRNLAYKDQNMSFFGPVTNTIELTQKGLEIRFGFNVFLNGS